MKTTLICILFVWTCILFAGMRFVSAAVDKHTVGLWLFDEGKGKVAKDSSDYEHHGDIMQDVKWRDGNFGKALEFTQGAVEIPDAEKLQLQEFTLEAWVNIPKQPGRHEIVIEKRQGGLRNYVMNVQENTSLIVGGFTQGGTWTNCVGTTNLTDGKWHHLAVTYDMDKMRVYVDGVEEKACAKNGQKPDMSNGILSIGRWGGMFVTGTIDEVHISNVARAEAEIKQSMKGQLVEAVESAGKLAMTWGLIKVAAQN